MKQKDEVAVYRLAQVLALYANLIRRLYGPSSFVFQAIDKYFYFSVSRINLLSLVSSAFDGFTDLLKEEAENLLRTSSPPTSDLNPPAHLKDMVEKLQLIIQAQDKSMVTEDEETDLLHHHRPSFEQVMARMIGPMVQACDIASIALEDKERAIFMLKCLRLIMVFGYAMATYCY